LPEELSLGHIVFAIVRKVLSEPFMPSANSLVELFDWCGGKIGNRTSVGVSIAHIL